MDSINWISDITQYPSIPALDWDALKQYAINLKRSMCQEEAPQHLTCHIPPIYNKGGLHLVRLLAFNDGTKRVARIQLDECTPDSKKRLLHEKHTLALLNIRSDIPVPTLYGYDTSGKLIGRPFMIMQFMPGSTAMDANGVCETHHGELPLTHRTKFCREIARIQLDRPLRLLPTVSGKLTIADSNDIPPVLENRHDNTIRRRVIRHRPNTRTRRSFRYSDRVSRSMGRHCEIPVVRINYSKNTTIRQRLSR